MGNAHQTRIQHSDDIMGYPNRLLDNRSLVIGAKPLPQFIGCIVVLPFLPSFSYPCLGLFLLLCPFAVLVNSEDEGYSIW